MNKKLRPFLIGFTALSLFLTLALAVTLTFLLSNLQDQSAHEHQVSSPLMAELAETKLQIVQIQQYLTDASVTGETDGLEDGLQALKNVQTALQRINTLDASLQSATAPLELSAQRLYDTGLSMVKAYAQGQAQGNALMKAADGFDAQSETAQTQVDALSTAITQRQRETSEGVQDLIRLSYLTTLLLPLVIVLILAFSGIYLYRQIFNLLGAEPNIGVHLAQRLASGDLSAEIQVRNNDRSSLIAQLSSMRNSWREVASNLNQQVTGMLQVFGNLRKDAQKLREEAQTQQQLAQALDNNLKEWESNTRGIAGRAETACVSAQGSHQDGRAGLQLIDRLTREMQTAQQGVDESTRQVQALAKATDGIQELISIIQGISGQTNLLALNAAIEAARAGESGRGFAVVADEVRNLANRTTEATNAITQIIQDIHNTSDAVVQAINEHATHVQSSVELSHSASKALAGLGQNASITDESVAAIRQDLLAQLNAMQNLAQQIEQISLISSDNAQSSGSIAGVAQTLDSMAQQVQKRMSYFRFN